MGFRAGVIALATALLATGPALAQGPPGAAKEAPKAGEDAERAERAREHYRIAAEAYEKERWALAANEFRRADIEVPNPVALALAIESATLAGDAVLAMTLVDRARGRPREARLDEQVKLAEKRFAGKTGTLRVTCPRVCDVVVDGASMQWGAPARVPAGVRAVKIRLAGHPTDERRITVGPDALVEIAYTPPAEPAPKAASGLSPAWFFVGLGATALAGAGAIASGADTASKHGAFVRAGCPGPMHGDCNAAASDGKAAEIRTNVLLGVTGALAAATAVMGVGLVRWSSPKGAEVSVGAAGAGVVVRGSL